MTRIAAKRRARFLTLGCLSAFVASLPLPLPLRADSGWTVEATHRWRPLPVDAASPTGFQLLPPESTGLAFTNHLDEWNGAANRVLYNGAGVAAGDIDGDGRPDLFLAHLGGTNALYRNLGTWRFQNVTAGSGLDRVIPETRGAVFADLNGNGHLDLLLAVNRQGVLCFTNNGHGHFTETTAAAGTASPVGPSGAGPTTLALADIDGNGTLDLYVTHYRPDDIRDRGRVNLSMVGGRPILPGAETNRFVILNGRLEECGQADRLLLNDGSGRFRPASWTDGTFLDEEGRPLAEPPLDWGLSATFRDVTGNGAPDLYVCNDYWTPDRFWINDGHGRFRAASAFALRKISASSMGVDFADLDRDGHPDFLVVDMLSRFPAMRKRQLMAQTPVAPRAGVFDDRPQVLRNTLYFQRGDGSFAETAFASGIAASDWSWAVLFADVDLDGYEDVLIGAGHFRDVQDYDAEREIQSRQRPRTGFRSERERQESFTRELMEHYRLYPPLDLPIAAFRNVDGTRFEERTADWGLDLPGIHHGMALADFDGDGLPDLVVNRLNAPVALFRRQSPAHRLAVRLRGAPPNTQAIGAQVTLVGGPVPRQTSEVVAGGRYLSGSNPLLAFATGPNPTHLSLEVRWRSGRITTLPEVRPNRLYEIAEASDSRPAPPPPAPERPAFEDVSPRLGARHHEIDFDDYQRQPLLPFQLSQLGPGLAWFDLDGDGWDDLVVGSGRGGHPGIFRNDTRGGFSPWPGPAPDPVPDDTAGLLGWRDPAGAPRLLMALTGYEQKLDRAALGLRLESGRLAPDPDLPPGMATASGLALGDPDGSGALTLFIGGGVVPGAYPLGAPSRLFRHDGTRWQPDARNNVLLENLGIVHAAVWADLDGDGLSELILACEWGPIRVFRFLRGALSEITAELGLASHTGWWRGIAVGDINGDGRLDLVAANWGHNSPYRASTNQPLTFVFGQLAQPGVTEIIETEYVGATLAPRRQFEPMARSMPFLFERFNSHRAYSEATLEQVLGDRLPLSRHVTATTLASTLFLNTGRGFQPVELPREAQFAPAFGIAIADLDGDGHEDVVLAQNFFGTHPETARIDAGLGLWLRGDGTGRFEAVPSRRSGIRVLGEQRGLALADFDRDGRIDLAIAQNAAEVKLYRNRAARPGLRVRLQGPPRNRSGIGAVLRLDFGERRGPARAVLAGSGFASQNAAVQVLATPAPPTALRVRWPGGRETVTHVSPGTLELVINTDGQSAAP